MSAEDLGWKGWTVIASIIVAFLLMGSDKVGPDIVFTVLVAFFTGARILDVNQAAAGYSNSGLLTVIFLYLVSEGIYQTGALEGAITKVLGKSRSPFWALVRMMIPTMALSAFLNNTPVVALLTPILISWARRSGVPAKKLLIPLSYSAVLGGTCTLIGTSTNLVVSGAQAARYEKQNKLEAVRFGIFDVAPQGVPYAIWGFLFIIFTQQFLLPGNTSKFHSNMLMALRVLDISPIIGKSFLDAGLNNLHGASLVGLMRNGVFIRDPSPKSIINAGDILYFAGEFDQVAFLAEDMGLMQVNHTTESNSRSIAQHTVDAQRQRRLVQVSVKATGSLVGQQLSGATILYDKLDSYVVAIVRGTKREDCPLSETMLEAGDILLLSCGTRCDENGRDFTDVFENVREVKEETTRDFIVALKVISNDVAGKTVSEAGLRGVPGLNVLAIDRDGNPEERIEPVGFSDVLNIGDVLWVGADLSIMSFLTKFPGMVMAQKQQADKIGVSALYQTLVQAVVSSNSNLVGYSARDVMFRRKYGASVMAIHREGVHAPLHSSLAVLQPGDVLLLQASTEWCAKHRNDRNFVMISEVLNSNPPKKNRALIAVFLGTAMVLTQIIPGVRNDPDWIHLWPCSVLTAALMLTFGCLSGDNARASILWDVYLAIAGAFGVSRAMEITGVANEIAQVFISIANSIGGRTAGLTSIYIATAVLSEILTNNAAGAIMYPIAAIAGDQLGIEPRALSIAIMLGASAGFANPFSYQCNMMVYTAGKYRTLEFVKIGVPFQIYLLFVAAIILHFYDNWGGVWIVSFCAAAGVVLLPAVWSLLSPSRQHSITTVVDKLLHTVTGGRAGKRRSDSSIALDSIPPSRDSYSDKGGNGSLSVQLGASSGKSTLSPRR